jgi:anti-anti-sigma factor
MSLHIEQRESEGVVILDLNGPLTLGHGDLQLRDSLAAPHESGKINIILNLHEVTDIDSTGLGTLVFGLAKLPEAVGAGAAKHRPEASETVLVNQAGDCANRRLQHLDILDFVQREDDTDSKHVNSRGGLGRIDSDAQTFRSFGPNPHR